MTDGNPSSRPTTTPWRRIGWFVLLWAASVLALAGIAWTLRAVMQFALA
jgi:hypothetical protein